MSEGTMQAVLDNVNAGLKIPKFLTSGVLSLIAIMLSSLLAATVLAVDNPGSALALSFLLPSLLLLKDWFTKRRSILEHALPIAACVALFGMALEPGFLNITLTWVLLSATAIAARNSNGISPYQLLGGVGRNTLRTPKLMAGDGISALKMANTKVAHVPRPQVAALALPVLAVGVFTLLLAFANPVIENLLLTFDLGTPLSLLVNVLDTLFSWGGFVFLCASAMLWPMLRGPTTTRPDIIASEASAPFWHRMFFKPTAVIATLLLLNLLFAVENVLDIWHVWMKAQLPDGMSHAAYVHRGSYTLIATAVLAGLLMVFAVWKGTATEQSKSVRALIYIWTLQNLLLVASSAKRTFDYIAAYGWSEWRLAGLLWMGLVFFGLASIIWRVAKGHDSRWLINTNLVAATLLLLFCAVVDMRDFIARQNLESVSGNGPGRMDFAYIESLGPSAIGPLLELEDKLRSNDITKNAGLAQLDVALC
jgi:hypothetical protein